MIEKSRFCPGCENEKIILAVQIEENNPPAASDPLTNKEATKKPLIAQGSSWITTGS